MVYSHDTFGLGNIRRMLSICRHLNDVLPDLSILLVTGSPMIHSFRLPPRLDYIKLPCLSRTDYDGYRVKSLGTSMDETMQLRSDLLLSAVTNFKPDLLLVDKKPYGVKRELEGMLRYVRFHFPATKQALILRDILDSPATTVQTWHKQNYYDAVQAFYDAVLVLGWPDVFDLSSEYDFPQAIAAKLQFCGYIEREPGRTSRRAMRDELQLRGDEKFVVVTPGGGEDGFEIIENYVAGLPLLPRHVRSLIISGPEMPEPQRRRLRHACLHNPQVNFLEFTDDLMSYLDAADAVVSMCGYNTICEILSLRKRAVVIPRVHPTQEQAIRAARLSALGLFQTLHPHRLTPQQLMQSVRDELQAAPPSAAFELDALANIAAWVKAALPEAAVPKKTIPASLVKAIPYL
jgi:predicted glycosyltransferase